MNNLEYKGYNGVVEFSSADNVFFGRIFGINDAITFEGESVKELVRAFHGAVDDYLETCKSIGKDPERPYRGNFNVRIDPNIHRKAALKARLLGISLNEFVERAIAIKVEEPALSPLVKKTRQATDADATDVELRTRTNHKRPKKSLKKMAKSRQGEGGKTKLRG